MIRFLALTFFIPLFWVNAFGEDINDLRAMCYLQGYAPASGHKNVTLYDKSKSFPGDNLYVSSHAPEAILMDMNGKTVHRWHYPSEALPLDLSHGIVSWASARLLKNGDLLVLLAMNGLLKIDKNSHLIWFKKMICHHDFDIDDNGNIFTLTAKYTKFENDAGIFDNSIAILYPNGEMKKEISFYTLFEKYPETQYINKIDTLSQAKTRFTNNGLIDESSPRDVFHANSIQVLDGRWAYKIPAFKKGNLLISMRSLGVIIAVDPDKEKIVWLMDKVFWNKGQHYAKLLDNGNIMLFDNLYHPNMSRVVEFDPAAQNEIWEYSGQNGLFFSAFFGEAQRLPNGNTLITASDSGHCIEVTPDKRIVWEFYNPYPADNNRLLSSIIYQLHRVPIDSNLDWLKN